MLICLVYLFIVRVFGLRVAGADEQAAALLARDPATRVSLDDPGGVADLLGSLWALGADEQAAALAGRAAAHAPLDDPAAAASLLDSLREAGADEQAAALAARDPAAHVSLDDPAAAASLLDGLRRAGAHEQAAALAARAAAHVPLDNPDHEAGYRNRDDNSPRRYRQQPRRHYRLRRGKG